MADNINSLSEREKEIMLLAWRCLEAPPKINYAALADRAGMTNIGSAQNAWLKVKKKLFDEDGSFSPATTTPKATPKATPRKRAAKGAAADTPTPSKRAKKNKVVDDGDYGTLDTPDDPTSQISDEA